MKDFKTAASEEQPRQGMVSEFLYFLKTSKKWWLLPIVVILVAVRLSGVPVRHRGRAVHLHAVLRMPTRRGIWSSWCGQAMTDAVRIPARRKFLYLSIVVLLLLGLCEGGLRLSAWLKYGTAAHRRSRSDAGQGRGRGPVRPDAGLRDQGRQHPHQDQFAGLPRRRSSARSSRQGTFRIVALGASTTFSAEASSNDAVWTAPAYRRSSRPPIPERPIEVINAAVGGYVADDNLKNLRSRVLPLDPDLVIYYEANNEIVRDTRELAIRDGLISADGRQAAGVVGGAVAGSA